MVNAKNSPSSVSLSGQLSNDLENKRQNWNVRLGPTGRGQGWRGVRGEADPCAEHHGFQVSKFSSQPN